MWRKVMRKFPRLSFLEIPLQEQSSPSSSIINIVIITATNLFSRVSFLPISCTTATTFKALIKSLIDQIRHLYTMSGCGYVNPKDLNMAFNPTTTTTISGSRSPGQNGPDTKFSAAAMPNMSGNGHGGKVDSRMVLTPAITPDEPGPIHTSTGTFGTTNSQSSPAFRPSNGQSSSVSGNPFFPADSALLSLSDLKFRLSSANILLRPY